ncbi:hypothetical protein T439DRAFT_274702, partial [Meredithblackwellia eburnea MCA 4105]
SKTMKMKVPATFSGCGEGLKKAVKTFVSQADIYLRMNPSSFPTEESKVLFAVSYLESNAYLWAQAYVK